MRAFGAARIVFLACVKDFTGGSSDNSHVVNDFVDATYRLLLRRSAQGDSGAAKYASRILNGSLSAPHFVAAMMVSDECQGNQRTQKTMRTQHASREAVRLRQQALQVVRGVAGVRSHAESNSTAASPAVQAYIRQNMADLVLAVAENDTDI
jgi:altronate dehydratase